MRFAPSVLPSRSLAPGAARDLSPLLGALGLALAWRAAAAPFGLSRLPSMLAGIVTAAWAFAVTAYAVKLIRRPAVLVDEVGILPGRAGLGAALVGIYAAARSCWTRLRRSWRGRCWSPAWRCTFAFGRW